MLGRALAAAGSVAIAAAVNVATGVLTQHWATAWWAATAALVVVGGGLQVWLTVADGSAKVQASGDGAIAAGGSVSNVSTTVTRTVAVDGAATEARNTVSDEQ